MEIHICCFLPKQSKVNSVYQEKREAEPDKLFPKITLTHASKARQVDFPVFHPVLYGEFLVQMRLSLNLNLIIFGF